jgi:hypothetical protein
MDAWSSIGAGDQRSGRISLGIVRPSTCLETASSCRYTLCGGSRRRRRPGLFMDICMLHTVRQEDRLEGFEPQICASSPHRVRHLLRPPDPSNPHHYHLRSYAHRNFQRERDAMEKSAGRSGRSVSLCTNHKPGLSWFPSKILIIRDPSTWRLGLPFSMTSPMTQASRAGRLISHTPDLRSKTTKR